MALFGGPQMDGMLRQNPMMLMAMASGLLGAPSLTEGLSRGFARAGQGMQADQNRSMQLYKTQLAQQEAEKDKRAQAAIAKWANAQTNLSPEARDLYANKPDLAAKIAPLPGTKTDVHGTPIYGTDEQGNTVLGVIAKDGSFRKLDTGGVTPTPGVRYLDTGTGYVPMSARSGRQVGGPVTKDVAGAEREKALGQSVGEAQAGLPSAVAKADRGIALIDSMMADPGREIATGLSAYYDPRNLFGSGYDFQQKNKQLQGQVFLESFQDLKGGGHITEIEGQKATDAAARLSTAQTEEAYLEALKEVRQFLILGRERARQKAGGQPAQQPMTSGTTYGNTGGNVIDFNSLPE